MLAVKRYLLGLLNSPEKRHLYRFPIPDRERYERSRAKYREPVGAQYVPTVYPILPDHVWICDTGVCCCRTCEA